MIRFFTKLKIFIHNFYYYKTSPKNGISYMIIKKALNKKNFYFNCTLCGNCCYGPGNVYFTERDLKNIKKFLMLENTKWKEFLQKLNLQKKNELYIYQVKSQCIFLEQNHRCKIYPVRPLQCRSFPFWPSIFSSQNTISQLIESCPGSYLYSTSNKTHSISSSEIVFYCNRTIKEFNSYQKKINRNWIRL